MEQLLEVKQIINKLNSQSKVLIVSHENIDADGISSMLIMNEVCKMKKVKEVRCVLADGYKGLEDKFLPEEVEFIKANTYEMDDEQKAYINECNVVIIVDTYMMKHLGDKVSKSIYNKTNTFDLIIIDHHNRTAKETLEKILEDKKINYDIAKLCILDYLEKPASNTSLLINSLFQTDFKSYLNTQTQINKNMYVIFEIIIHGILSDTFLFKSFGTKTEDIKAFCAMSEFVGNDLGNIYRKLYNNIALIDYAYQNIVTDSYLDSYSSYISGFGQVVFVPVIFESEGSSKGDMKLVSAVRNQLAQMFSYKDVAAICFLFYRKGGNELRVNILSMCEEIDAQKVAEGRGGGGHYYAAWYTRKIDGMPSNKKAILEKIHKIEVAPLFDEIYQTIMSNIGK